MIGFEESISRLTGDAEGKFLLAVSGGVDSMVMLHLFHRAGKKFEVVHANFNLRDEESDGDERFVREACSKLDIRCRVRKFDTRRFMEEHGLSVQEAARELRYHWFRELLDNSEFSWLATAHHRDDSVETFLINALRGCGPRGLRGIAESNEKFIRPLANVSRKDIEEFARSNEIEFREDSTNESDEYLRNRIRHNVIPPLSKVRDDYPTGLLHTMRNMDSAAQLIAEQAQNWWNTYSRKEGQRVLIARAGFEVAHSSLLAHEVFSSLGFNAEQIRAITDDLPRATSGKRIIGDRFALIADRDDLVMVGKSDLEHSRVYKLLENEEGKVSQGWSLDWRPVNVEKMELTFSSLEALLDEKRLSFPLELRTWKEGDTFQPLGMRGKKKVSDFLTDQKVSSADKPKVLVLCSGGEVAWVVGHRISDSFKVTPATRRLVHFRYSPAES